MGRFKFLSSRRGTLRAFSPAISLGVIVLLSACPAQTDDFPRGMVSTVPAEIDRPSASPPSKTKSAQARCRKRVENVKHERFFPDTYREASNVVLPVVFPDGSSAQLVYPPRLKLAELGVQPAVSVGIERSGSRVLHERFLLITKAPVGKFRSDDPPIKTYQGASGKVRVWRAKDPEDFLHPIFIQFRIGTWNIIVGDGNVGDFMGADNRRLWAESLGGYETEEGFIVIEPRSPLAFATGPGEPDIYLSTCFRFVELRLQDCKDLKGSVLAKDQTAHTVDGVTIHRNATRRQFYANWCTPSRQISVYLDDHSKSFVDLAVRGLKVRNVNVRQR